MGKTQRDNPLSYKTCEALISTSEPRADTSAIVSTNPLRKKTPTTLLPSSLYAFGWKPDPEYKIRHDPPSQGAYPFDHSPPGSPRSQAETPIRASPMARANILPPPNGGLACASFPLPNPGGSFASLKDPTVWPWPTDSPQLRERHPRNGFLSWRSICRRRTTTARLSWTSSHFWTPILRASYSSRGLHLYPTTGHSHTSRSNKGYKIHVYPYQRPIFAKHTSGGTPTRPHHTLGWWVLNCLQNAYYLVKECPPSSPIRRLPYGYHLRGRTPAPHGRESGYYCQLPPTTGGWTR